MVMISCGKYLIIIKTERRKKMGTEMNRNLEIETSENIEQTIQDETNVALDLAYYATD
jgi:hypothetical protein